MRSSVCYLPCLSLIFLIFKMGNMRIALSLCYRYVTNYPKTQWFKRATIFTVHMAEVSKGFLVQTGFHLGSFMSLIFFQYQWSSLGSFSWGCRVREAKRKHARSLRAQIWNLMLSFSLMSSAKTSHMATLKFKGKENIPCLPYEHPNEWMLQVGWR